LQFFWKDFWFGTLLSTCRFALAVKSLPTMGESSIGSSKQENGSKITEAQACSYTRPSDMCVQNQALGRGTCTRSVHPTSNLGSVAKPPACWHVISVCQRSVVAYKTTKGFSVLSPWLAHSPCTRFINEVTFDLSGIECHPQSADYLRQPQHRVSEMKMTVIFLCIGNGAPGSRLQQQHPLCCQTY
jgi:hypothetical protein